jgi:hypothetical protein
MRRRAVVAVFGIAAVGAPFVSLAQQAPSYARVGWLAHGDTMPRHFFDEALARLGWVEGKNITIERRSAAPAENKKTVPRRKSSHGGRTLSSPWAPLMRDPCSLGCSSIGTS